jgi:hypothetical protein
MEADRRTKKRDITIQAKLPCTRHTKSVKSCDVQGFVASHL